MKNRIALRIHNILTKVAEYRGVWNFDQITLTYHVTKSQTCDISEIGKIINLIYESNNAFEFLFDPLCVLVLFCNFN